MTWLNSGIRVFLLAQGTAARWLREELNSLTVRIRLTDGCVSSRCLLRSRMRSLRR